jgi:hypothetical protein
MSVPLPPGGPTLDDLFALFPDAGDRPAYATVPPEQVPPPYRGLLVHAHHMTVTVEAFYGQPVDVDVLVTARADAVYSRKILLRLHDDPARRVVQFGLMTIDLDLCTPRVRDEILEQKTPLGRILIRNGVLTQVQPTSFLRVEPGEATSRWFGLREPRTTYGRLGVIFTDGKPAIEVLEILAPIDGA